MTNNEWQAQVCRQDVVNGDGAGTLWFVRLPDGYLLACGCGYGADDRAKDVARRLNESYAAIDLDDDLDAGLPSIDDVRGVLKP